MNQEAPHPSISTAKEGSSSSSSHKPETSIKIFRRFLNATTHLNAADEAGGYDASVVIGRECYDDWLSNRAATPRDPERMFQRSLSSHVTSVDGRQPFSPKEEEAILKVLRKKQVWCVSDLLLIDAADDESIN